METNGKEKYLPPNLATIEHLRSRLNPERGMDNKESTVLACKKCNKEASDRELAELPIEEIWRMSGSYPNRSKWRKKNEKVRIKKAD